MNIRIHFFNISCAGFFCAPGAFWAADAREVYPLNSSWDFSFNREPAGKVEAPHTGNAEDAANGVQGKREDAKSVNSGAYRRGPAVYSRTFADEEFSQPCILSGLHDLLSRFFRVRKCF